MIQKGDEELRIYLRQHLLSCDGVLVGHAHRSVRITWRHRPPLPRTRALWTNPSSLLGTSGCRLRLK